MRSSAVWIVVLSLWGASVAPAAEKVGAGAKAAKAETAPASRWSAETFQGLELRAIGPALMSGRIADVAIHPHDQSTWYVAVGSGGVWKTTNAGTTWTPIFDDQGSYSIGCVTLDPNRPDTVWVGTGENVGGRHVGFGDGVYKSLDGGASWTRTGLEKSEHIGKIVVDPRDSDVVYVASQGPLWSGGGDRGLFKTTDGGGSWAKILGGGEFTGVNEVVLDPRNADTLYATTHQRLRTVAALINGGPESGIHKSTDGGATWRELRRGLPEEDMGRIGLAVSPQKPDIVYATVELARREGGFYRSSDGGESWEKRSDYLSGGTGPHYYQEIFASPHAFDRIYQMDVELHVSHDGGATFAPVGEEFKHGDNHALAFDPEDPDYLLCGSDGGLYESWDLGKSWKFIDNLPVTQFYKVALDNGVPFYNVYGGTQDNNTQGGPSRTDTIHGIRNSDWFVTLFGDGHQPAVDPSNSDIVYSEWQQGNLVRYDRKTGEMVYVQPQPAAGEGAERWNWDAPILVSPHDPARLYYASHRVWRSDDRGDSWRAISGDLSRGLDRLALPMMGRVWSVDAIWDLFAMSNYGSITSLAESPWVEGLLYAGTDDGVLQVSEDGGASWRRVEKLPGVADFFFVNDVKADLHDADTAYVAVDHHKDGDFKPYLLKSTDRGRSWRSIAGDLPDRHLVWRVVQDHVRPELLFAATEFGVFFTLDGGGRWVELEGGVPQIAIRDLAIQRRENDLVAASFGRGFFVFDDFAPLREVSAETLEREAELFQVRDAWWYVPKRTLGLNEKAQQGDDFFTAPNPPFGAVFTYYLRDDLESRAAERQAREKEIAEAGGDTPYPGWDALRLEDQEDEPAIVATVYDAAGQVVRRIVGPTSAGFHRIAWDLRYPILDAWTPPDEAEEDFLGNEGWLAAPGTYTVSLAKRVDGATTELGEPRSFRVVPVREGTLPSMPAAEAAAFFREIGELQRRLTGARAVIRETDRRLGAVRDVLARSTIADAGFHAQAVALGKRLYALGEKLDGPRLQGGLGEPTPLSIAQRLQKVSIGNRFSTYGPTPTHRGSFDVASAELEELRTELDALRAELRSLEAELEAAGVPWSPGREVPGGR